VEGQPRASLWEKPISTILTRAAKSSLPPGRFCRNLADGAGGRVPLAFSRGLAFPTPRRPCVEVRPTAWNEGVVLTPGRAVVAGAGEKESWRKPFHILRSGLRHGPRSSAQQSNQGRPPQDHLSNKVVDSRGGPTRGRSSAGETEEPRKSDEALERPPSPVPRPPWPPEWAAVAGRTLQGGSG